MRTREDHCTHPDQTWCDCDWCRVIRAQASAALVPWTEVQYETAYGQTTRLSSPVRCF